MTLVPSLAFVPKMQTLNTASPPGFLSKHQVVTSPLNYASFNEQTGDLINKLPPVDSSKMSKLEIEFRQLLEGILYTKNEIESITQPRMRAIYEGVAASYYEPAVYRAFEVLYADYSPLRVAGRIVYQKLTENMEESKIYKDNQIGAILDATEMTIEEAEDSWSAFVRYAGDRELSAEKLQRIADVEESFEYPFRDSVTFEEFVNCFSDAMDLSRIANLLREAQQTEANNSHSTLDEKRARYNARYDEMLIKFAEWKAFIPDGEGRRLDILRGCFVGSENPKVVEALRIIYTDYTALRLSGNWIFSVVSTLMGAAQRRRERLET